MGCALFTQGLCGWSLWHLPTILWSGTLHANQRHISGAQLSTVSGLSLVVEPIDLTLLCANDRVSLPAGQLVLLLIWWGMWSPWKPCAIAAVAAAIGATGWWPALMERERAHPFTVINNQITGDFIGGGVVLFLEPSSTWASALFFIYGTS